MAAGALRHGVFCAQLASTLAMCGLIWFVQIVHYPLFLRADPESFSAFEAEHATRTGFVVAPLMIVELVSAGLLLRGALRPAGISGVEALAGLALVMVIWGSTGLLQIPLHNRLDRGFDRNVIRRLVATNWVRTVAWTMRGVLVTVWAYRLLTVA